MIPTYGCGLLSGDPITDAQGGEAHSGAYQKGRVAIYVLIGSVIVVGGILAVMAHKSRNKPMPLRRIRSWSR